MPQTFLPFLHGNIPTPQGEPDKGLEVFELMKSHPEQERRDMVWDSKLATLATAKCAAMALEGWAAHVSPEGIGANWIVRQAGYDLPSHYMQGQDGNNIESLSWSGNGTVKQTWDSWLNSPAHRQHILATLSFFADQIVVGVGYVAGGQYKHYWAIWSVPNKAE